MHMSTAVKTPTIALFGSSNPSRWGPFWHGHTIIARNSMDEDYCPRRVISSGETPVERLGGNVYFFQRVECRLG